MIEFLTSAVLVIALILVILFWIALFVGAVGPDIKAVYNHYKEKFHASPSDR